MHFYLFFLHLVSVIVHAFVFAGERDNNDVAKTFNLSVPRIDYCFIVVHKYKAGIEQTTEG